MTGSIDADLLAQAREVAAENPDTGFEIQYDRQMLVRECFTDGEKVTFGQMVGDQAEIVMGIGETFEAALGELLDTIQRVIEADEHNSREDLRFELGFARAEAKKALIEGMSELSAPAQKRLDTMLGSVGLKGDVAAEPGQEKTDAD